MWGNWECINLAEIGGNLQILWKYGEMCNMHYWLKGMTATGILTGEGMEQGRCMEASAIKLNLRF